jgi:hypothetical protein
MQEVREAKDKRREREIQDIIQREKDGSFWKGLNYIIGKPQRSTSQRVQVVDTQNKGALVQHNMHALLQEAVFDNVQHKSSSSWKLPLFAKSPYTVCLVIMLQHMQPRQF